MDMATIRGIYGLAWLLFLPSGMRAEGLKFNRDVRPILSENCFFCHGQDPKHRKADLRLDLAEEATADHDGVRAIVPGKPEESALIKRIENTDPDEMMPPPESHKTLKPEQILLLRQWIAEGASYEKHWSFQPAVRVAVPSVKQTDWVKQPMDALVLAKLESASLAPSPAATPERWLRRVSLDLTGIAPTAQELDVFAAAVPTQGEAAFAAAVDRLLAHPRFGERMAQDWMDAARYADSHGFNNDTNREMWRWRDWVIEAFNENKPYDRFLTEQLAGDLLPSPTLEQRIATGFCRNHVINSEGGIIGEEYRVEYVVDRVRTLGMSTLGLTLECARCHDHKFDPITQKDYYALFAFFNQLEESGEDGRTANASPLLASPTKAQAATLAEMDEKIAALAAKTPRDLNAILTPPTAAWSLGAKAGAEGAFALVNEAKPDEAPLAEGLKNLKQDPTRGAVLQFTGESGQKIKRPVDFDKAWSFSGWVNWQGGEGTIFSNQNFSFPMSSDSYGRGVTLRLTAQGQVEMRMAVHWPAYNVQTISRERLAPNIWQHVTIVSDGTRRGRGLRVFLNGQEATQIKVHDGLEAGGLNQDDFALGEDRLPVPARLRGSLAALQFFDRALELKEFVPWSEEELAKLQTDRQKLWRELPTTMIMEELSTPRTTSVLKRGQYDAPGEKVQPGVPEGLLGAWPEGAPRNRLGLAAWLTKPEHPLTARVAVNRFWQQLFGVGLVKTAEDFGFQGEYPPQLELLDWLARDFVEGGWNVKQLLRSIVLSATYRQDSAISPGLLERDPENRLLARGARFRLPAEQIRDHALFASGLLKERVGGPSVFPPQPPDLYKGIVVAAAYAGTSWVESTGDDRYRRSFYTHLKRTVPYPVLNVLDAPDREFCAVRRSRTNTPLQALTLMNETGMVEAAQHFGKRLMTEGGTTPAERLTHGFRLATSRAPRPAELASLQHTFGKFLEDFTNDPAAAQAYAATEKPEPDLASYIAIASLLLNLDESLTKN